MFLAFGKGSAIFMGWRICLPQNACGGRKVVPILLLPSDLMRLQRSTADETFGRKPKGFTLVEVMVVVVIIGLLAAAGLPSYRHLTMRSKVTALENDLRQFSTAAQTYTTQNGHWPADSAPQVPRPSWPAACPAISRSRPGSAGFINGAPAATSTASRPRRASRSSLGHGQSGQRRRRAVDHARSPDGRRQS